MWSLTIECLALPASQNRCERGSSWSKNVPRLRACGWRRWRRGMPSCRKWSGRQQPASGRRRQKVNCYDSAPRSFRCHMHTRTRERARAHTHIHTRARTRIHTYMVYVGGETNAARAGLGASGVSATPSNPLLRPSRPLSLCPSCLLLFPPSTPLLNTCCMLSYAHAAGAHHGDGSRQERSAGRGGTVPAVR